MIITVVIPEFSLSPENFNYPGNSFTFGKMYKM